MDESYGILKKLAGDNSYTALARMLSSAASTRDTAATLRKLTKDDIRYAHMGQLVIDRDVCYATFLQNPGEDGEKTDSRTSEIVLAVFPLERALAADFSAAQDVTYRTIGKLGDTFAGYEAVSSFKENSMCLVGEKIYICFCFLCRDERYRIFRVIYDIPSGAFEDETPMMIRCRGETSDFTDEAVNRIYRDEGCAACAPGMVELVSRWSEYHGEYYATFLTVGGKQNGMIIKTADFRTAEFVSVIPENTEGVAEASSYIFRDKLYIACRHDYFLAHMSLHVMDLTDGTWLPPYLIEDGNARPWFFVRDGELYLLNTTEEYFRRYTNVSRVRTMDGFLGYRAPLETMATLYECGFYYAVCEYGNRLFVISSNMLDGAHTVYFSELKLKLFDASKAGKRLLALFEEETEEK